MHQPHQSLALVCGYALIIGVGRLQNAPATEQPIAANDTHALAEALGDAGGYGYPVAHITLLVNGGCYP